MNYLDFEHTKNPVFISLSFDFPVIQTTLFWKFCRSMDFIIHVIICEKAGGGKKVKHLKRN